MGYAHSAGAWHAPGIIAFGSVALHYARHRPEVPDVVSHPAVEVLHLEPEMGTVWEGVRSVDEAQVWLVVEPPRASSD